MLPYEAGSTHLSFPLQIVFFRRTFQFSMNVNTINLQNLMELIKKMMEFIFFILFKIFTLMASCFSLVDR